MLRGGVPARAASRGPRLGARGGGGRPGPQRSRPAEFLFLQSALGLSKGNPSSHLARLESGGLVEITKSFVGKKPLTTAAVTPAGTEAVARSWEQLDRLRGIGRPGG